MAIAETLLSVFLMGMVSPAACALKCSNAYKTPVGSHSLTQRTPHKERHHHGCGDSVASNTLCWRADSCRSNCRVAMGAVRNSQVSETNIQSPLGLVRVSVGPSNLVAEQSIHLIIALDAPPGPQFPILRI